MRKAISDYSVPLRIVGLAALALLAACSPTATQTRTLVPLTTPTVVAAMGGEEWHYVVLGDSQMWGIGDYYAKYIEADLRVKVELDDYWKGLTTATDLLDDLRTFDVVRNAVKRANVVTLHTNPAGSIGWHAATLHESDKYDCSDQALANYKADLDAIFGEILTLRKGQPTIIRVMGNYANFHLFSEWKRLGMYDEYKRCSEAAVAIYYQAAAEHNIPIADVFSAFNGPNHDQDPRDKGYMLEDDMHPSDAGRQVIADQFRKLGYEYIVP